MKDSLKKIRSKKKLTSTFKFKTSQKKLFRKPIKKISKLFLGQTGGQLEDFQVLISLTPNQPGQKRDLSANYPNFSDLKQQLNQQPHNQDSQSDFWRPFLSDQQSDQLEIELSIHSGSTAIGLNLCYQNLFLVANNKFKVYGLMFQNFKPDRSQLFIPIPTNRSFEYDQIVTKNKGIKSSNILQSETLKNFNDQKHLNVVKRPTYFAKILNKLYFKLNTETNLWETNLHQLYALLGFHYNLENFSQISINPVSEFWSYDSELSHLKGLLSSQSNQIGISHLGVKVRSTQDPIKGATDLATSLSSPTKTSTNTTTTTISTSIQEDKSGSQKEITIQSKQANESLIGAITSRLKLQAGSDPSNYNLIITPQEKAIITYHDELFEVLEATFDHKQTLKGEKKAHKIELTEIPSTVTLSLDELYQSVLPAPIDLEYLIPGQKTKQIVRLFKQHTTIPCQKVHNIDLSSTPSDFSKLTLTLIFYHHKIEKTIDIPAKQLSLSLTFEINSTGQLLFNDEMVINSVFDPQKDH